MDTKIHLDPVHAGPDSYGHHINLKSLKTSMTVKFLIILQNLIKTTRIRSRVNGVLGNCLIFLLKNTTNILGFHMTSRRPYLCPLANNGGHDCVPGRCSGN